MPNNRFYFDGLEELKADLRNLPEALANEGGVIVQEHAFTAAAAVRAVYERHRVSGNLANGVVVETPARNRFGVGMVVRSKAKHAWLFDNGSQARHWASGKSTGAMWGKTPPTHVFVATMMRFRRAMYRSLGDLLRRHGLTVSGEEAA